MTKDAQRITLAEWRGWKFVPSHDRPYGENYDALVAVPESWLSPNDERSDLPDYLNDLNAVHELEKRLTVETPVYLRELRRVCAFSQWPLKDIIEHCIFATAAQRCEALLRALGLWKEDE